MRCKIVNILEMKQPEKHKMEIRGIIDTSKMDGLNQIEKALKDTSDAVIKMKNTAYNHTEYLEIPVGFDIETTQIDKGKDEHFAYMYIWQMCVGNYVVTGRTWNQWHRVMEMIQKRFGLATWDEDVYNKGRKRTVHCKKQAILWIANSSFEFQFIGKQKHNGNCIVCFDEDNEYGNTFSDDVRRPVTFGLDFTGNGAGFYCLDALRISGGSLKSLAKDYCVTQKMKDDDGNSDLDYSIIRNSQTVLTDKEMQYCINDVVILAEWDYYYKNAYMKQCKYMPLTRTGIIRHAVKQNWDAQKFTPDGWLFSLFPESMSEYYTVMADLYRGAYTHANGKHVGKLLEKVHGMDFTSSYPAVLLQPDCKYPMSKFMQIDGIYTDKELDAFDRRFNATEQKACWYAKITFFGIACTTCHSLESASKVEEYNGSPVEFENVFHGILDNGRVLYADQMTVTICEQDWYNYKDFYDWIGCEVHWVKASKAGDLPDYFTKVIKEMYKRKSVLKKAGMDGTLDYILAKGFVNGLYGLCVQKIHFDTIQFNPYAEESWTDYHIHSVNKDGYFSQKYVDGKVSKEEIDESPEWWDAEYRSNFCKPKTDKHGNQIGIEMTTHLSPYWGVWCTAHARRRILKAIKALGEDAIYSDTDSVYFLNYEKNKPYFDKWNADIAKMNKKAFGKDYDDIGDLGEFDPVVIKDDGKKYPEYSFCTYGAKRYIKYTESWKLEQTIAGLPKGVLVDTARARIKKKMGIENPSNEMIVKWCVDNFNETLELGFCEAMKKASRYNDKPHSDIVTDEQGHTETMTETSSMCLYDIGFSLSVDDEWLTRIRNNVMYALARACREECERFKGVVV